MIILVGASASGKTEVAKLLRDRFNITKAITHTSRKPRIGEQNGIDYFFVSREEFLKLRGQHFFVETTEYNGNFYGCSLSQVSEDKCVVVDPNGLRSFLALHDPSVVSFLLLAEEKTRESRMEGRGDKKEDIEKRIVLDRFDFRRDNIAPVDFVIATDNKNLVQIADEIHLDYLDTLLKRRGKDS